VEEQTLLVAGSNPSFRLTREESHVASLKCHSPYGTTPCTDLDGAVPQHHSENMLLLHLQIRFSDWPEYIHRYSHYSAWLLAAELDAVIAMKSSARFGPNERIQA
jgi:hypothetical protein